MRALPMSREVSYSRRQIKNRKPSNRFATRLEKIKNGTFGKCLADGKQIPEKRLNAIPWTPYCLKHEKELEIVKGVQTPTL